MGLLDVLLFEVICSKIRWEERELGLIIIIWVVGGGNK